MAATSAQPAFGVGCIAEDALQQTWRFGAVMCALNLLLPIGIFLYAGFTGEHYAYLFWGERNVITWFSSVQLLLVGLVAYANFEAADLLRRLAGSDPRRLPWIWLVFALAFVFLAIDERFEFHEFLRDDVFRPGGMFVIPYLRSGDVSMYFYLAIGLVFAAFLLRELLLRPPSLLLFGAALLLVASTVVVDTLDKSITRSWRFYEFWTSAYEEVGEIWAQLLFLLAFLVVLRERLEQLGSTPAPTRDAAR